MNHRKGPAQPEMGMGINKLICLYFLQHCDKSITNLFLIFIYMCKWTDGQNQRSNLYATDYELSSGFRKRRLEKSTRRCTVSPAATIERRGKRWILTTIRPLFP